MTLWSKIKDTRNFPLIALSVGLGAACATVFHYRNELEEETKELEKKARKEKEQLSKEK